VRLNHSVIPACFKRESRFWIPDTFSEKNIKFFPKSAPRIKRERKDIRGWPSSDTVGRLPNDESTVRSVFVVSA